MRAVVPLRRDGVSPLALRRNPYEPCLHHGLRNEGTLELDHLAEFFEDYWPAAAALDLVPRESVISPNRHTTVSTMVKSVLENAP